MTLLFVSVDRRNTEYVRIREVCEDLAREVQSDLAGSMKRRLRPGKTEYQSNGIEDDIAQHPELASLCPELLRVSQTASCNCRCLVKSLRCR